MKAAFYHVFDPSNPTGSAELSEERLKIIRKLEQLPLQLFAVYIDESSHGESNTQALEQCLLDFEKGIFDTLIIL